jgi:6-phosphofructokinase 2
VPPELYGRLARAAREHGTRVIVDTSGDALAAALEEGVFLIKPNLHELATLIGEEELEGPRIREAAAELVREGNVEHVIVSMGSGGAILVDKETTKQFTAPTVRVRSRIGAGDSMIGGIALAIARGEPMETATRWGIAAGAAAVMTPGTELCRGEDARRLFEQVGT